MRLSDRLKKLELALRPQTEGLLAVFITSERASLAEIAAAHEAALAGIEQRDGIEARNAARAFHVVLCGVKALPVSVAPANVTTH